MSYTRPPAVTRAGQGLKQTPVPSTQAIAPVLLDAEIATTTQLGMIKVGSGLTVTPLGVLSATGGSSTNTWTPNLVGSVAGTIALTVYTAKYTKTGQQVTCYFDFKINSISGGSSSSKLTLSGLPVASVTGPGYAGSVLFSYYSNFDKNINTVTGTVPASSTTATLWYQQNPGQSLGFLTQDAIKSNTTLTGIVTYLSAS